MNDTTKHTYLGRPLTVTDEFTHDDFRDPDDALVGIRYADGSWNSDFPYRGVDPQTMEVPTVTEYKVVSACGGDPHIASCDLMNDVNAYLAEGWELQGGVSLSVSETVNDRWCYIAQALTRRVPATPAQV